MRINSASDDAAALALATELNAQGAVYAVAKREFGSGTSVLSLAGAYKGRAHSTSGGGRWSRRRIQPDRNLVDLQREAAILLRVKLSVGVRRRFKH
jgi:hypothetical protein